MKKQRCSQRSIPQRVARATVPAFALVCSAAGAVAQDPRAPEAVGSIPTQTVSAGQSTSVDLNPYFRDADGDPLAYAATVSDVATATVSVSGNMLAITGVARGVVVLTVFASDPGGLSATQRTQVTVEVPNQAPELVGTIPGQTLGPGQWISISVSSYFRDPEGEPLSFSATTSSPGVASVAVSGDIVTITQGGRGTAIVNAVARDPDGLSVQQSITVAAAPDGIAPEPAQPGRAPSDPPQPRRAQPGAPTVDEAGAGARSARVRQPDPFPPRLLAGFVASTGYTLTQGRSQVSAGYLGASPAAQLGELGDVWPGVGQVSYGVTDDLTIMTGSGFVYYNVGGGDSDLFPYVAPKFRAWSNDRISVAIGGYGAMLVAEENVTYYGGSVAASVAVDDALGLHASAGGFGVRATVFGESLTDEVGVFAVGGDFRVTPELGLAAEFRRVAIEDGTNILTAGLRFLGTTIAGEAGLAYYLEDEAEIRPIVSVAYQF